jgi:hypothetical protein
MEPRPGRSGESDRNVIAVTLRSPPVAVQAATGRRLGRRVRGYSRRPRLARAGGDGPTGARPQPCRQTADEAGSGRAAGRRPPSQRARPPILRPREKACLPAWQHPALNLAAPQTTGHSHVRVTARAGQKARAHSHARVTTSWTGRPPTPAPPPSSGAAPCTPAGRGPPRDRPEPAGRRRPSTARPIPRPRTGDLPVPSASAPAAPRRAPSSSSRSQAGNPASPRGFASG